MGMLCTDAGQASEIKKLPTPVISGGMPVMDAINKRASGRLYDKSRPVDDQTLSEILWVAWGMNTGGKRTIATARNQQNMKLYVLTPEAVWFYNAPENQLEKVLDKNLIPLTATICERCTGTPPLRGKRRQMGALSRRLRLPERVPLRHFQGTRYRHPRPD